MSTLSSSINSIEQYVRRQTRFVNGNMSAMCTAIETTEAVGISWPSSTVDKAQQYADRLAVLAQGPGPRSAYTVKDLTADDYRERADDEITADVARHTSQQMRHNLVREAAQAALDDLRLDLHTALPDIITEAADLVDTYGPMHEQDEATVDIMAKAYRSASEHTLTPEASRAQARQVMDPTPWTNVRDAYVAALAATGALKDMEVNDAAHYLFQWMDEEWMDLVKDKDVMNPSALGTAWNWDRIALDRGVERRACRDIDELDTRTHQLNDLAVRYNRDVRERGTKRKR